MVLLFFMLSVSPFYEANFTSLPIRSLSVFSNPAGLGRQPGAENFFTYHPDHMATGISLGNVGFGTSKIDTVRYYEAGVGIKLPGAFSLGYAYQFDFKDYGVSNHILGIMCRQNQYLSFGYKTTIGERFHHFGGIGIKPYKQYVTLNLDCEYEGVDTIFNYYYGGTFQPLKGLNINLFADNELNWNAGLELSFGKAIISGLYSQKDKKFSGGIILSAQNYKSLLPVRKKIARLTLKGNYPELDRKSFLGIPIKTRPGFPKLLNDLKSLKKRDDIKTVLVELKDNSLGPGQREELRNVLLELKKAGKRLVFFADNYNNIFAYELACIGDEIILSPSGSVVIPGIAMRKLYLKETLEKLGMQTDIVAIGKYKSATEIFSRKDMSDADRQQINKYLDDIYEPILNNIAGGRNKTKEKIIDIINNIAYLNSDDAKSYGLIDTTLYRFELKDYLREKYGKMKIVKLGVLTRKNFVDEIWRREKTKIALVIAEGSIVSGEGKPNFFQLNLIGGEKYAKIFDDIRKDKGIKAVVFRINSGGGDAFASEEIAYALKRCAEKKPVIVSMGDVAASGGYYIACLAHKIYADNQTVTGSIGVLNVKLVNKGLYDKLGISWDLVKRGEHTDAFWDLRHFTEEELKKEEREVGWWYDKFTHRVAQGRDMSQHRVDSLGQGRIYSGKYARELGLVDETAGFLGALEAAKHAAGIKGEIEIVTYPKSCAFTFFKKSSANSNFLYLMPDFELY